MKKIIFSRNFNLPESIVIFLLSLFFFPKLNLFKYFISVVIHEYSPSLFVTIILYLLFFATLTSLFTKKGVLIDKKKLFKAQYLFSKVIYRKEIALDNISDISILKFRGKVVNNDFSFKPMSGLLKGDYSIERDEIYLLNKTHTIKIFVIHTENNELSKKAVEIIKDELNLDFKLYNPRF